jgi:hypothetical protein
MNFPALATTTSDLLSFCFAGALAIEENSHHE